MCIQIQNKKPQVKYLQKEGKQHGHGNNGSSFAYYAVSTVCVIELKIENMNRIMR